MMKYWTIAQCTTSIWNIVHIPKKSVVDLYVSDVGNSPRSLFREKKKLQNYHIYEKKLLRSRCFFLHVLHFIDPLCIVHMKSV